MGLVEGDAVKAGDGLREGEALAVADGRWLGDRLPVRDGVGRREPLGDSVREGEGDGVWLWLWEREVDRLWLEVSGRLLLPPHKPFKWLIPAAVTSTQNLDVCDTCCVGVSLRTQTHSNTSCTP